MHIYIWENVRNLTDNYHSGGGCAVIAKTLEEARKLLPANCTASTEGPDFSAPVEARESKAFIFPDSGCC